MTAIKKAETVSAVAPPVSPDEMFTKTVWLLDHHRIVKPRARSKTVPWKGRELKAYKLNQTIPADKYHLALLIYLRLFWEPFRTTAYHLAGNQEKTFTARGGLPCSRVLEALCGDGLVGVRAVAGQSISWIAIDLDCHFGTTEIFLAQAEALLKNLWGKWNSQIVIARWRARGLHLILYRSGPMSIHRLRLEVHELLATIHQQHPEVASLVEQFNAQESDRSHHVKQINELEVFPDIKSGFRLFGHGAKDVIADDVIGYVEFDTYKKGPRQGQPKRRFDLEKWAASFGQPRMPLNELMELIKTRRAPNGVSEAVPELILAPESSRAHAAPTPSVASQAEKTQISKIDGGYFRTCRQKLVEYWTGKDCPPGILRKRATVLIRACKAFEADEEEVIELLENLIRKLPPEASSRIAQEQWDELDRDLQKMVRDIYGRGFLPDQERSDQEWEITKQAWQSYGFDPRDPKTWANKPRPKIAAKTPAWSREDEQDIGKYLGPVLRVLPAEAVQVATEFVLLVQDKEREGNGIGYEYLKTWLKDKFNIKCGKREKQQAVFKALRELGIIEQSCRAMPKRRATCWGLGWRSTTAVGEP